MAQGLSLLETKRVQPGNHSVAGVLRPTSCVVLWACLSKDTIKRPSQQSTSGSATASITS